jgi:predicted PhzF superfamily epimerase YddE/YHI9
MPNHLTDAEMQRIAAAVGLSETAFVSASETEAFRLDFFTPNSRIAHCGHATVATFSYLASLGRVAEGNAVSARMFAPRYGIDEESATGMAAAPLACLLHDRLRIAGDTIVIEQGMFMAPPSPSLLEADWT